MIVDSVRAEGNIGFDPTKVSAPVSASAHERIASSDDTDDLRREIIDFDSEGPEGAAFLAFTRSTGPSRFTDKPWPRGLAPVTGDKPSGSGVGPLPRADALVVTWNVSDPEIDAAGLTLKQQPAQAAKIYKAFGRWSSVCSAIACWALIAAL